MITLTKQEAQQMYEVPLIEQLESVPKDARLRIDDADGMGTHYFPIGSMCHKAAEALRAKLSEPEIQPVAWMWDVYNGAGYSSRGIGFQQTDIPFAKHTPLYTTPPQRDKGQKCHSD